MKRKVLISVDDALPDRPPASTVPLAVDTHDDYECQTHGKRDDMNVVKITYALTEGIGTPYRPSEAFQCMDCFNSCLRIVAKRAKIRHAMWEDGWEICCDICRKADRDLRVSQRRLFVKDKNPTESTGWDSHPTYLICDECEARSVMVCLHNLYWEELDE